MPTTAAPAGDLLFIQPKRKVAAGFATALALAAGSWWLALGGNPFGRPAALLFGLFALALLVVLLSPKSAALRVADDGFETIALAGGGFYPWDAVQSIEPTKLMGAAVLGVAVDADRVDVGRTGRHYAKLHGWHVPIMDAYGAPLAEIHTAMQKRFDAHRVRRAVAAAGR
jgi:hypothetical protein